MIGLRPEDPLVTALGSIEKPGAGPFGRISDFEWAVSPFNDLDVWWSVDALAGLSDYVVRIFKDGAPFATVAASQPQFVTLIHTPGQSRCQYEFFLCSAKTTIFDDWPFFSQKTYANSVRVSWVLSGDVHRVEVYKNETSGGPVVTTRAGKVFTKPVPALSGAPTGVSVSGAYLDPFDPSVTLTVTTSRAGGNSDEADSPGDAAIHEIDFGGVTYTFQPSTVLREVFNGIRLQFPEGYAATLATTFDVVIQLPEEHTFPDVGNGEHTFKVGTFDAAGNRTLSSTDASATVAARPSAPTYDEPTYSDGSGEVALTFNIPDESNIATLRIYRNYPAGGIGDLYPVPWAVFSVTPGGTQAVTVVGLQEGRNKIVGRCVNDAGLEEENLSWYSLDLDASLNEAIVPNAPTQITATLEADYSVTVKVFGVDVNAETINLFVGDNDEPDYSSVWETITNPQTTPNATLTKTGLTLAAGVWSIAARAITSTGGEENTDIRATLLVETSAAAEATTLAAEVV